MMFTLRVWRSPYAYDGRHARLVHVQDELVVEFRASGVWMPEEGWAEVLLDGLVIHRGVEAHAAAVVLPSPLTPGPLWFLEHETRNTEPWAPNPIPNICTWENRVEKGASAALSCARITVASRFSGRWAACCLGIHDIEGFRV